MKIKSIIYLFIFAISLNTANAQAGLQLSGAGVVNRSFGGTAVAAPIDAAGALHWNPATLSGFSSDEFSMGLEFLEVDATLTSGIDALGVSGSSENTNSASPIPSVALVHRSPENKDLSYGLGLYAVGGFSVTYPANPQSPVSAPQPPVSSGLGRLIGEAEFLNLVPAVSYQATEEFSFGLAPVLSIGRIQADPLVLAVPNSNGSYPTGTDSDYTYGGGFQLGGYYKNSDGIHLGASYKSQQWFDEYRVDTSDEFGLPRSERFDLDLPQIISVGAAYSGIEKFLFASDVRYFDYNSADGFKQNGFAPEGNLKGLGWDSIYAVSAGVQYEASKCLSFRAGYFYNENPISSNTAGFNLISPLITEHMVSIGTTFALTEKLGLTLAYLHAFENEMEGNIQTPLGAVPGSSVKSTVSADAYAFGIVYKM